MNELIEIHSHAITILEAKIKRYKTVLQLGIANPCDMWTAGDSLVQAEKRVRQYRHHINVIKALVAELRSERTEV